MEGPSPEASRADSQSPGLARDGEADQQWYWVKAQYKAVRLGRPRKRHDWQRIVFLIRGPASSNTAWLSGETDPYLREKASRVAREKEHEYAVAGGDTLRWVLQEIEDIQPLFDPAIEEGTEVYWEFFERVDRPAN